MRAGVVYELPMQGHHTNASEYSSLPTPTTQDSSGQCRDHGGDLLHEVICGCPRSDRKQNLFPTPVAADWKNGRPGDGYGPNLPQTTAALMPTPKALDGVKGNLKTSQERLDSGHQVDLPNVAIDLLGTPRANAANSSSKQVELGAPKSRLEDQVHTDWGKFEPAIRRWETILGRPAPEPTKPDGKDNNHRLSSKFTEWMMGLPDGWITGHDLKRNDELKLAGNGVVPQQAELALRLLLDLPERDK
jgi:DNA (cytosine-5)-methyltransferase 1